MKELLVPKEYLHLIISIIKRTKGIVPITELREISGPDFISTTTEWLFCLICGLNVGLQDRKLKSYNTCEKPTMFLEKGGYEIFI